jgi:ATP-dependent RNA helicase RhlE
MNTAPNAPVSGFAALGLAEPILRAVTGEGYTTPTPIQQQTIPVVLAGRDVMGIAQTGTGKTAAFVLPLLHQLSANNVPAKPRHCRALILAPTRELASQIADSVRAYGKHVRLTVSIIVGGAKPGPQVKQMARGVDIVVATPGRLLDHMNTGAVNVSQVVSVVLDEADQMLDLGFIPAIRQIMSKMPAKRQTMLLSATMPKQIRALASDFLSNPQDIAVAPTAKPIDLIEQKVLIVPNVAKRDILIEMLHTQNVERGIIFTRTKHGADKLVKQLEAVGLAAATIHGNKSQPQRERALAAFRNGNVSLMVATDIAARGIDIDGISHVFNYELPHVPESYVHRIGRTARAGATGIAISLCDPSERNLLRMIERLIGRQLALSGETLAAEMQQSVRKNAASRQQFVRRDAEPAKRVDTRDFDSRRDDSRRGEGRARPERRDDSRSFEARRDDSQAPRRPARPQRRDFDAAAPAPRGDYQDRPARQDNPRQETSRHEKPWNDKPRTDLPRHARGGDDRFHDTRQDSRPDSRPRSHQRDDRAGQEPREYRAKYRGPNDRNVQDGEGRRHGQDGDRRQDRFGDNSHAPRSHAPRAHKGASSGQFAGQRNANAPQESYGHKSHAGKGGAHKSASGHGAAPGGRDHKPRSQKPGGGFKSARPGAAKQGGSRQPARGR